ncbi:hypothetical protein RT723_00890 [Psychrosphaera aquimarina]|uniref:Uncharacterized protein n=1 Tax=Psychrosphaera aquimarina TaxID=2044854 RepID=A0ABU3QVX1_9GAMM|nr:hypothetical protein [Psychrosphaera aquimarina]MDU0111586.1 hypothetical protein [Psychrosphaera aquimarina]
MYMPSKFMNQMISSAQIGVFCESNRNGDQVIIAKLPTSTIKAINFGAKIEFYIITTSKTPHYLALCMRIFDNESSPMDAILAQKWQNSNNIFNSSFLNTELDLVLFDETDAPTLKGKIKLKTNFRNKRVHNILNNFQFISADNYDSCNNFIDSACANLGHNYKAHPKYPIVSFKIATVLTKLKSILTIHGNEQGSTHYDLINDIDGIRQERQIYQSLCLMDNSSTTLSPLVQIGKKERELTDILTITNDSEIIAFESKSLEFNESTILKSYERITSNIIKHCNKALKQLEGVFKAIQREERVYDDKNNTLLFNGNYTFYGIVIIDEYRLSNNWDNILFTLNKISEEHHICLNILTLSEMLYTLKLCKSDIQLFVKSLEKRHRACINNNSINIQFMDGTLPNI